MAPAMELKAQLAAALGTNGLPYWRTLGDFLCARISRQEFDDILQDLINTPDLIQLHNSLLLSLLTTASLSTPKMPMPSSLRPLRKRRRIRAFQGIESDELTSSRSARLKRWSLGAGKRERERIRSLETTLPTQEPPQYDEIARDRSLKSLPEVKDPAKASRLPSATHSISRQLIHERVSLIAAHNEMTHVTNSVSPFLSLALESKLKNIISHCLSQTSTSRAITSIRPTHASSSSTTLTTSAFETTFTLSPALLPHRSAAATRLAVGEPDYDEERERVTWTLGKGSKGNQSGTHEDPRWQMLALLKDRSGIREALTKGTDLLFP